MNRWVCLIVAACGVIVSVIPWVLYARTARAIEAMLRQETEPVIAVYGQGASVLKWVFLVIGVGLIVMGVVGAIRGRQRDPRM